MRLVRLSATIFVGALVFLTGCSSGGQTSAQKLLTIPVILPLTGPGAEYGIGDRVATEIAIKQINDAGGIDGTKLQYKVYDDGSGAVKSALVMRGLIKDSLVVLGPNLSTTAQAAFPVANAAKMPAITSSVSDQVIMQKNRPWTFDLFIPAQELEPLGAQKWLAAKHVKSVVAIVDKEQDAATSQAAAMLGELQKQGVQVLKTIQVSESQPGYRAEANVAKSLHPDGIVVSGYPDASGAITKALRGTGVNQPILFTTTSVTPDSLKVGGVSMTNGNVILEYWPHMMGKQAEEFNDAFVKADKGQEPEPTAAYMYDSVLLAAQAIKNSGLIKAKGSLQDKREMLRTALLRTKFTGATGTFTLNSQGIRPGTGVWVEVRDGKVVSPEQ